MKEIGDFLTSQAKAGRAIRICICDENGEVMEVKWNAAGAACDKKCDDSSKCCKKDEEAVK